MNAIKNRYDFVLLFDVKDGNPNGDPDAGNLPRIDPETGHGLVSDVCLKRKVRNYIGLTRPEARGFDIYVKEKAILSEQQGRAYAELGSAKGDESVDKDKKEKKGKKREDGAVVSEARQKMCELFFDVRTFGAVMSLKENNAGQVRGPVQVTFARSVDPIVSLEHSITRMAVATTAEADKQGGDNRTMGRKMTVPYGLYQAYGFVSPALAGQTGFNEQDLELFWKALDQMFEHDRSASRGLMTTRKLYVFKHASALGDARAQTLFDTVKVSRKDPARAPRDFSDYEVVLSEPPKGVERVELVR